MNYTPTFGSQPLDAWTASLTYSTRRMVMLFLAGGLGNLIGALPHMDLYRLPFAFFSLVGYPLVLVQNFTSAPGVCVSGLFLVLLSLIMITPVRLVHACALAVIAQSLLTFLSDPEHHLSSWVIYLALVSPLLGVYFVFFRDRLRRGLCVHYPPMIHQTCCGRSVRLR